MFVFVFACACADTCTFLSMCVILTENTVKKLRIADTYSVRDWQLCPSMCGLLASSFLSSRNDTSLAFVAETLTRVA